MHRRLISVAFSAVTIEPTRVIVDDDGPRIPEGERERVFERFARGSARRLHDRS